MTRSQRSDALGRFPVDLPIPSLPTGPYDLIVADPPWKYGFGYRGTGGAIYQYPLLTQDKLKAMHADVWNITHPDTYLCLWATGPKLPEALELMDAWHFDYTTMLFVWVKINADGSIYSGLGHHVNANAEFVLLGKRRTYSPNGAVVYTAKRERTDRAIKQIIRAPKSRHSAKPQEMYDRLLKLYQAETRLDMFSRQVRPGFTSWGLEAPDYPSNEEVA